MRKLLTLLTLLLFSTSLILAQQIKPLAEHVQKAKAQGDHFEYNAPFSLKNDSRDQSDMRKIVSKGSLLKLDMQKVQDLYQYGLETLELELPQKNGNPISLLLVEHFTIAPNFKAITDKNPEGVPVYPGRHYRGIIKGQPNSIAAISIYPEEIMGMFSNSSIGNYVLGKWQQNRQASPDTYVLYEDHNLLDNPGISCSTQDDGGTYSPEELKPSQQRSVNCVKLYFETEQDMYLNKGSVQNVANYVTGIYNQVATIYTNDGISTTLEPIFVWTGTDPYTASNTSGTLSQFQSYRTTMSGDLGQLLTFRSLGGGIAAGFSGICNSSTAQKLSVSAINTTYQNFPTYTWTIMVVTHEYGHTFGSRHTHACVWNGNNTAIDGCSGFTEGSCFIPGIPSGGGTIMSYCHIQSVGINFSLGFGPQPGALVLSRVNNGACLIPCSGGCPTTQNITATQTGTATYQASSTITSTADITASGDVEYKAGLSITLNTGFYSYAGSDFLGHIAPCTTPGGGNGNGNNGQDPNSPALSSLNSNNYQDFYLKAYPNPFTDQTTIEYFLPEEASVQLRLLNNLGQEVLILTQKDQVSGTQKVKLDAADLPGGVYFCELRTTDRIETYKLMISK